MKKLIALILFLLMVILIFASCDANREEQSGEPVSELPSDETSFSDDLVFTKTIRNETDYTVKEFQNNAHSVYLVTFQNTDQTIFTLAQLDFQPSVYAETNTRFRVTARAANDNPIFYFYDIEKKKCSPAYSSKNEGLWNSDELILSFDKAGFYILELYSGVVVSKYVVDLEGVDSFLSCELNQNGNSLCVTYVEVDGLTINEVIVPLAS